MSKITIDTKLGKVIGSEENGVRMFTGIPYAVTERFESPKPYPAWDEFDATGLAIDCIQNRTYHDESGEFYHEEFRPGTSAKDWKFAESPMTMNIITRSDANRDPVLIFIHGGSFENGCVSENPYGTCTEYAKHKIVYISLGYRLNVFGLYKSQNYGLQDMVFGIKWVKEHIADYGGDPGKITIMGESAGAMSVMDLLYSQTLKGVIRGAIMMSGGGTVPDMAGPYTPEESDEVFWSKVREEAGASSEEEFKAMPAETIFEAWLHCARTIGTVRTQQPGIDGTIIPKMPSKIMREGSYLDVPVIAGVTSQDFMPYIIFDIAEGMGIVRDLHSHYPVWGYMFDRELPGNKYKAFHASDLWYMFGNMDKAGGRLAKKITNSKTRWCTT
jgi:para-nitrobenzyl esterase